MIKRKTNSAVAIGCLGMLFAMFASGAKVSADFPLGLNHFFIVVDEETYTAIKESEFIQSEFGFFEERTTNRPDMSYTGFYIYGENTYFEFLVANEAGLKLGSSAVAFGMDNEGESDQLVEALKKGRYESFRSPIMREFEKEQVPWFEITAPQAEVESDFSVFFMEYLPQFLEQWRPGLAPEEGGVTRKEILTRYKSHLSTTRDFKKPLFVDVTEVHLELTQEEAAAFTKLGTAIGLKTVEAEVPEVVDDDGIRYLLHVKDESRGIVAFRMNLSESRSYFQPFALGSSQLEIDGKTATWRMLKE